MEEDALDPELIETRLAELADQAVAEKAASLDPASWHMVEKNILLQSLDHHWKEHLATLDALRQVVHLRAHAQKTPINEYKQEAFARSEEHTSELQSLMRISYAVFCLKKKQIINALRKHITHSGSIVFKTLKMANT